MSFGWHQNRSHGGSLKYVKSNYVILPSVQICHLGYHFVWRKCDFWSGVKIYHLVGRQNMSFCLALKYVIWSGVEICHLVGYRNMSFGWVLKYVIWSDVKYVIKFGIEIYLLFGHRNMSFGRASKYVDWLGVKIYFLVWR